MIVNPSMDAVPMLTYTAIPRLFISPSIRHLATASEHFNVTAFARQNADALSRLHAPANIPGLEIIMSPPAALSCAACRADMSTVNEHDDDPAELLNPTVHVAQSALPSCRSADVAESLLNVPLGQGVHVLEPADEEYVPALQIEQTLAPIDAAYMPTAQSRHDVTEL